jgi:hypothetical protein
LVTHDNHMGSTLITTGYKSECVVLRTGRLVPILTKAPVGCVVGEEVPPPNPRPLLCVVGKASLWRD